RAVPPTGSGQRARRGRRGRPAAGGPRGRGGPLVSSRVTARPPVGPPVPWSFPEPSVVDLSNGMRLLTVDLPGQHVLSLRVSLPLPVSHEEPGTEGATLLMARALDEGTERHSAEQLAELAERNGIAWGAGAGERGVHLGLEVTARHLGTAVALLTECLSEATFPGGEVARLVRHQIGRAHV